MARILLSCHQFFPRYYTGTEVLTLEVADELKKRGHEVAILTTEPLLPGDVEPSDIELLEDTFEGYKIWKLIIPHPPNIVDRLDRESYEYPLATYYKRVLEEWCPDIVHAFHLMRLTTTFVNCVKQLGIPFYFTPTDFWMICPTYQLVRYNGSLCTGHNPRACFSCLVDLYSKGMKSIPVHYRIAIKFPLLAFILNSTARKSQSIIAERIKRHQQLISNIDGVFFANTFLKDIFHRNGLLNSNENILPFPIPKRSEKVLDLDVPTAEGPLKVAFIGTLRPTKGPQILLDACVKIGNQAKLEVDIWGASDNTSFEEDLRKRVKNINWVRFCGTFPQKQFPDILKNVHAVVIPSLWYENTPLTALSTLAARRVLIASNLGGLSTLIEDGVSGFLFPAGNADALASILVKLSENRELVLKIADSAQPPNRISSYVSEIVDAYGI